MDGIDVRNLGGADNRRYVQVAIAQAGRPNADRFIGKTHVQRVAICLAIDSNGLDAQLFARANDAQGNLAAIRNEYLFKHG